MRQLFSNQTTDITSIFLHFDAQLSSCTIELNMPDGQYPDNQGYYQTAIFRKLRLKRQAQHYAPRTN